MRLASSKSTTQLRPIIKRNAILSFLAWDVTHSIEFSNRRFVFGWMLYEFKKVCILRVWAILILFFSLFTSLLLHIFGRVQKFGVADERIRSKNSKCLIAAPSAIAPHLTDQIDCFPFACVCVQRKPKQFGACSTLISFQ